MKFTLYQKALAVNIGGFLLGSSSSWHITKSTSPVMAVHHNHSNQLYLTRIESYCKLTIKDTTTFETTTIWVARVSFYDAHDCKVWLGGPTQVVV